MSEISTSANANPDDAAHEGRESSFMDIDRMINEGLGGGTVSMHNGLIDDSTTDTMDHPESVLGGGGTE
ncbi:hypothetical protein [Paenibacillus puerhi]|uniref:hypothetical protein n=1 Tax=Paenibacillus puerhi TaxID=2692622 RepID=UPI0013586CCC|nr:hypothetical protein [Paenibacillus puerhi]